MENALEDGAEVSTSHQPVGEEESVRIEHDRSIELNEELRGFIVSRPVERVISRVIGFTSLVTKEGWRWD